MAKWTPQATHEITLRVDTLEFVAIFRLDQKPAGEVDVFNLDAEGLRNLGCILWNDETMMNGAIQKASFECCRINDIGIFMEDIEKGHMVPRVKMAGDPTTWRLA